MCALFCTLCMLLWYFLVNWSGKLYSTYVPRIPVLLVPFYFFHASTSTSQQIALDPWSMLMHMRPGLIKICNLWLAVTVPLDWALISLQSPGLGYNRLLPVETCTYLSSSTDPNVPSSHIP